MDQALLILKTASNAVLPIVLLILLGYWLRRINFVSADFVKLGNKLVFNVFLPCMLFINVYDIKGFDSISWDIVIYSVIMVFLIFLLGVGLAVFVTKTPRMRGPITQCTFRSNFAIIGLPLATALGGTEAAATAAIISAFTIPVFNILAVLSLTMYETGDGKSRLDIKGILKKIAKNPLIISIMLGLICLGLRSLQTAVFGKTVFMMKDIGFVYDTVNKLKSIASPFALVVLGGQFTFSAVKSLWKEIAVGTVGRIVIAPVLGIGLAIILNALGILNCGTTEIPALIALFGSPAAVSSAVMAAQMGSDEQLAVQLVVWTSILSIITIFLTVCLLMATGFIAI